jgi:hypothetical protein
VAGILGKELSSRLALVFAGLPDQEAGRTSAHADLLVASRADALVQREARPAAPHPEGVAA